MKKTQNLSQKFLRKFAKAKIMIKIKSNKKNVKTSLNFLVQKFQVP